MSESPRRRNPEGRERFFRAPRHEQVQREWRGEWALDTRRNVSSAQQWLDEVLEKVGLRGGVEFEELQRAWKDLVGPGLASETAPGRLKRGVLFIEVLQPTARFYLEEIRPLLLQRLQERFGREVIGNIQFIMG